MSGQRASSIVDGREALDLRARLGGPHHPEGVNALEADVSGGVIEPAPERRDGSCAQGRRALHGVEDVVDALAGWLRLLASSAASSRTRMSAASLRGSNQHVTA